SFHDDSDEDLLHI
nr:Chain C, Cation-independent mannose-6-phosphate receptor [synthetic construct]1JWG_D Chain D, Cation-independent mannose-6-phosphate receptor [synthetic construct]